ncbi:MAG: hypothetical protein E6J75_15750, partial [Deltaproteobacteria bacterium]
MSRQRRNARHAVNRVSVKLEDVAGRALVIHEGGDNYSDTPKPLGGGGVRMACGGRHQAREVALDPPRGPRRSWHGKRRRARLGRCTAGICSGFSSRTSRAIRRSSRASNASVASSRRMSTASSAPVATGT